MSLNLTLRAEVKRLRPAVRIIRSKTPKINPGRLTRLIVLKKIRGKRSIPKAKRV
jgi:hypothetical protein